MVVHKVQAGITVIMKSPQAQHKFCVLSLLYKATLKNLNGPSFHFMNSVTVQKIHW
jgi:hypothetical protein